MPPKRRNSSNPGSAASSPKASPKPTPKASPKAKSRPKRSETPPPPQQPASAQEPGTPRRRVSTKAPASASTKDVLRIKALWAFYTSLLINKPIITKATTAAVISAVGAVFSQLYLQGAPEVDVGRTARFAFVNFVLVGPVIHLWYAVLNRFISRPGFSGAFLRVAADQTLFSPLFNFVFLSLLFSLNQQSFTLATWDKWIETMKESYMMWPVANFLIFLLVPVHLQLLVGNIFQLAWSVILSQKDQPGPTAASIPTMAAAAMAEAAVADL